MLLKYVIQIFLLPYLSVVCALDLDIVKKLHQSPTHVVVVIAVCFFSIFYVCILIYEFVVEYLMIYDISIIIQFPYRTVIDKEDVYSYKYRLSIHHSNKTNTWEMMLWYIFRNILAMFKFGLIFNHMYTYYSDLPEFTTFFWYFIWYNVIENIQMYIVLKNGFNALK